METTDKQATVARMERDGLVQLQQSAQLSGPTTGMVRRQLSKVGEMILTMYQQYESGLGQTL